MYTYYRKWVIIPAGLVVLLSLIYLVYEESANPTKSEWMTGEGIIVITMIEALANALLVALLSLPIFLSPNSKIKNNPLLVFLCWLACPLCWLLVLLTITVYSWLTPHGYDSATDYMFVLINTIPYIVTLIWGFINFKRSKRLNMPQA